MSTLIFPYILSHLLPFIQEITITAFSPQCYRVNILKIILPTMSRAWGQDEKYIPIPNETSLLLVLYVSKTHTIERPCVWEGAVRRSAQDSRGGTAGPLCTHVVCRRQTEGGFFFSFNSLFLYFWLYWAFVAFF